MNQNQLGPNLIAPLNEALKAVGDFRYKPHALEQMFLVVMSVRQEDGDESTSLEMLEALESSFARFSMECAFWSCLLSGHTKFAGVADDGDIQVCLTSSGKKIAGEAAK